MATAPNIPPGTVVGTVPAPPGITPNFIDPPRDSAPLILTIVFLTLSVVFVSMRLFTRVVLLRGFGWDDATCLIATQFRVYETPLLKSESGFFIDADLVVSHGLGTNLWNIPFGGFDLIAWARWTYVQDLVYSLVMGFIKISILMLYFRLFKVVGVVRWLIWGTIVYIILYTVMGDLITIFACRPLNKLWDGLPYGWCMSTAAVGLALASLQITADVFVLAIPVPVILGLQLPVKQKLGVMSIFGAGIFVTIASCVRLACLVQSLNDPANALDATTSTVSFAIWTVVEMYLAIIVSCMSTVKPFLYKVRPWVREISTRRSQYSKTSYTLQKQVSPPRRSGGQSFSDNADTIRVENSFEVECEDVQRKREFGMRYPNLSRVDIPGPYLELRRSGNWGVEGCV
ncbi:hypothetical protein MMC17_003291 [Xylographa soralifera]|nr:hypothetical protein [Xylographa soralifera]